MSKRECPLQLDHFVYVPTIRGLEPISVFGKDFGKIPYTFLGSVRLQKRDGAEQVDFGAGLRIPRGQLLSFSQELFSIFESALFLALGCVLEEGGSSFQRLINVSHVASLCHRANLGWLNILYITHFHPDVYQATERATRRARSLQTVSENPCLEQSTNLDPQIRERLKKVWEEIDKREAVEATSFRLTGAIGNQQVRGEREFADVSPERRFGAFLRPLFRRNSNPRADQNCLDGYLVFFLSVFNILRSAFRCAFAYFFCAFSCFLCAFRTSRFWDAPVVRGCAQAGTDHPTLKMPSKINAASLIMNVSTDPSMILP